MRSNPTDSVYTTWFENVWEWTDGGKKDARPMRGGSFVDTLSGEYNHAFVCSRMTKYAR